MNTMSSFVEAGAVFPSNSTPLDFAALYIGVTGNVAVELANGDTVTFSNVPVGFFPVRGVKVLLTGTTAAGIVWGRW